MHELSIAQGLCNALARVAEEHRAQRIQSAVVEVGEMSNVVPQLLEDAFAALREIEPLLEGCRLEIRPVSLVGRCGACGQECSIQGFVFRCPQCGSGSVDVLRGDELLLRDVELEIEEERDHEPSAARADAGASAQVE